MCLRLDPLCAASCSGALVGAPLRPYSHAAGPARVRRANQSASGEGSGLQSQQQAPNVFGMTPRAFTAGRDAFGKLLSTADERDWDEDEDADIQGATGRPVRRRVGCPRQPPGAVRPARRVSSAVRADGWAPA